MKDFDKIGLIKQSWEIAKKNYKIILMLLGTFFLVNIIQGMVGNLFRGSALSFIVSLAFTALALFLEIGFLKIVLKLIDGQKAEFSELWAYPQYFVNMVIGTIVYGLIVGVGLILFVIPGIYLAIRLQFYSFVIVDKDAKPIDSLKKSWKMTEGNVINLFLFMLILLLLNIAGAIVLLVGLLVTIPISFVAVALLYRKLSA